MWFDHWVRKILWRSALATHSSILAWRIPWTEEPGGLQSMGLQGVRHDWAINTFILTLSMCISLPLSFPCHMLFICSSYLLSFFLLIQKLKNMYVCLFWMLIIYWSHALQRYSPRLWLELKTQIFTIITMWTFMEITLNLKRTKLPALEIPFIPS